MSGSDGACREIDLLYSDATMSVRVDEAGYVRFTWDGRNATFTSGAIASNEALKIAEAFSSAADFEAETYGS